MRGRLLALLALLTGCSGGSMILVEIESDLRVPEELDRVEVEVAGQRAVATLEPGALPATLQLHTDSDLLGPYDLVVVGRLGDAEVVRATRRVEFRAGGTIRVTVRLEGACAGVMCAASERCEAGACVPLDVDAGTPRDAGRDDAGAEDAGPGDDGGRDAGARDAGGRDAGPRDAGMICTPDCTGASCDCTAGCTCDAMTCPSDDCTPRCSGSGTSCRVDATAASNVVGGTCRDGARCSVNARGVSNVDFDCRNPGTRCIIDCTNASNCFVQCAGNAACELRCAGASNCEIQACPGGGATSCPGDVYVCDAPCP